MTDYLIAPSILAADFACLGQEVERVLKAGADVVHFDVMDNHYVPNLTIGPMVCKALRDHGVTAPIDVHLMVKPVDRMISDFIETGASYITFHPEAGPHPHRTAQAIRAAGCRVGVSLNPGTPLAVLDQLLGLVDLVLVMSVNPGFGGQSFITSQLEKISQLRRLIGASGRDIELEVDGGVNRETAAQVIAAGANVLVAGTATFKGGPTLYAENITALREAGQT